MKLQKSIFEKILFPLFLLLPVYFLIHFSAETNVSAQIASGLHNPTFCASGLAQGNAVVARTHDASAVLFNPAGLTQLERAEVSVGASFVTPFIEYHGNGISEDMDTQINTIPNVYYASPIINNTLAAGIGITVPYGLSGEWEEDGFSRYVVTDFYLQVININPTITYKPFSFLSVGAGFDYYTTEFDLERRLNLGALNSSLTGTAIDPSTSEGYQDIDDMHGDGYGYNVGILYNITPRHSIGASFRSKADIDVKGSMKFFNLSGATAGIFGAETYSTRAKTDTTIPEMLTFGYAYHHGERWSMEADIQWTNWSRFDDLRYSFDPTNILLESDNTDERNWHNTLGVALGGEYQINAALKARGGYSFHETPVPSDTFEPSVPQGSRHGIHLGAGYGWGKYLNKVVDVAYSAIFYEDRTINNSVGDASLGPIDGTYEIITHILAVNFTYKF